MGFITLEKQTAPSTPPSGKGRLFIEGTTVKFMDDTGAIYTLTATTTEEIQDIVGALVTAGSGISITYNDAGDTLQISSTITQYTDEQAQDAVGGALTDTSNIIFTYNDPSNTISADLSTTGVVAGSYGSADTVPILTIDNTGRITSATNSTPTWTELVLGAAVTNSSNSAWQDISDLSLSVTAGSTYRIDYCMMFQSAATTTGLSITLYTPDTAAGTFALAMRLPQGNDGTGNTYSGTINAFGDIVTSPSVQTANANFIMALEGVFVASVSGTIVLRARSEINGSQITIAAGSSVLSRRFT
jgi:hypothetical protein